MPHSSPSFFYENRYSAFSALSEIHLTLFLDKLLSRGTIYRFFKQFSDGIKQIFLKDCVGLEIVSESVEIIGQSPYRTSKGFALFLGC